MRFVLLILVLLYAGPPTFPQILPLRNYGVNEGLVSNDVLDLAQDARGYLWIATAEGINRYDGRAFERFRTTEGLPSNYITCAAASQVNPGVMWFSAWGEALCRFEDGRFEILRDDSSGLGAIAALMEDTEGNLWCGTTTATLVIRDGVIRRVCANDMDIPGYLIVQTRQEVWVGTPGFIHLFTLQHEAIGTIRLADFGIRSVDCMLAAKDGTVWIGTDDGFLVQFRDRTVVSRRYLGITNPLQIVEDGENNLWVCTGNGLLVVPASGGPVYRYSTANGLSNNVVGSALFDSEGNLWFSSSSNGLSKLASRETFSFPIRPFPSEIQLSVLAMATTDNQGHLWVCAGDGLWELWKQSGRSWESFRHVTTPGLRDLSTSVLTDRQGRLWTWTADKHVQGYEVIPGSPSVVREFENWRANTHEIGIDGLRFVDSQMRFWFVVNNGGIAVYDKRFRLIRHYTTADGLPSNDIRAMCEDNKGNLWCGGVVGGVVMIDGNNLRQDWTRPDGSDGLRDQGIRSMATDVNGNVLIGTRYNGLFVYRNNLFQQVSIDDGLISNGVYALAGNTDGTWWAGTGSGLQAVDATGLIPRKPVKDLTGQIVYVCGLVPNDYVWSLSAGPTTSLLTVHGLAGSTRNTVPPPVYITTLFVNSEQESLSGRMEFSHEQNTLTLGFVGLSFKDEKETRFQHRLLGGGGEWSPLSEERSVTYAGLTPGDYVFEVKAFNNDGVPSTTTATLEFSISPPFWRTWWFFLSIVLVIAGLLWGFYRNRVAGILALERMRFRIARDLHDDVGGTLSGITHLAEAAAAEGEGDKTTQRLLKRIAESSTAVQASLDDIVWSLNPTPDTWEALIAKCRRYASDLCEARGIQHVIEIPPATGKTIMPPVVKENFWLLFKEMVTNAVRHSGGTTIVVRLALEDSTVKLLVEDNGKGFDSGVQTTRNGLRNLRLRADALGAVTNLVSTPGQGTCWSISFRIRK